MKAEDLYDKYYADGDDTDFGPDEQHLLDLL
jgi:hypothetical protein